MSKSRITTANIKSSNYNESHQIFVGTHTGSFKKIETFAEDPHKQTNLQNISALNKFSRITSLDWGDSNEILIGRANNFVKIYDVQSNDFSSNVEMLDGPIVGLARYEGKLIAGIANGTVEIFSDSPTLLQAGDHLSQMRQCKQNKKLVATGGKERKNNLKLWDLESQKQIFTSKNVPNDYLQLEVPVWDTDLQFVDAHQLITCSRYGYIRTYDTRQQRRPVLEYVNNKKQPAMVFTCLATHGHSAYVGTASGILQAFDLRKLKTIAHTYKGFTGSVSDVGVDETGKYVYTACLDRFVRVHCAESTALQYQCYVKSKATKILLRNQSQDLNDTDCVFMGSCDENEDEQQSDNEEFFEANGGSDPEFDELFDNMPTVGEEIAETDETKSSKKRKVADKEQTTSKKKK